MFNLAIDNKLRACDLVRLKVADVAVGDTVRSRVTVVQRKIIRPVQFEVIENTRATILEWVSSPAMIGRTHIFPSPLHDRPHSSKRRYARLVTD